MNTLQALKKRFAAAIPNLKWRVHGLGVLQAYISEGGDTESRLHIWHPDLCTTNDTGRPHNHRFDLKSLILVGELTHNIWHLEEDLRGEWYKYSVVPRRQQAGNESDLQRISNISYRRKIVGERKTAGDIYTFSKGMYHTTVTNRLCVSLVEMTNKFGSATVLGRKDTIVHAGIGVKSPEDCRMYLDMAVEELLK